MVRLWVTCQSLQAKNKKPVFEAEAVGLAFPD
jgi:hypothetical protein